MFRTQITLYTRSMILRQEDAKVVVTHTPGHQDFLNHYWISVLQNEATVAKIELDRRESKVGNTTKKRGNKPRHYSRFPTMIAAVEAFVEQHAVGAEPRRRSATKQLDACDARNGAGFRLVDLLHHLWATVPGLYKHGIDLR